ncbi:MAG: hypothetical protein KAS39_06290, partial [Actinomycetia bacterium]|nr:hypothetical protein [Actinomycetes bacterium]
GDAPPEEDTESPELDELIEVTEKSEAPESAADIKPLDLTDEQLINIQNFVKELPTELKKTIRGIIIREKIPTAEMNTLLTLLMEKASPAKLEKFLTGKVKLPGKSKKKAKSKKKKRKAKKPARYGRSGVEELFETVLNISKLALPAFIILSCLIFGTYFSVRRMNSQRILKKGIIFIKQDEYDNAEKSFFDGLNKNPGFSLFRINEAKIHLDYGNTYLEYGEYEKAREKYKAGLLKNKKYDKFYYGLTKSYYFEKDYNNAQKNIEKAIRLKRKNLDYADFKGRILIDSGKEDQAVDFYNNTIRNMKRGKVLTLARLLKIYLRKDDAGHQYNLGSSYVISGFAKDDSSA